MTAKVYTSMLQNLVLSILLTSFVIPLSAQNTSGRITGQVLDPSQSAVADVAITALHSATGQSFRAATDATGFYVFPNVPIGTYRITAEHAGFETHVIDKVTVDVGQAVRINVTMSVGSVTQQIEVVSVAPVIETSDASLGATMQNTQISELPINGRDYGRFALLTPGAVLRSAQIADLTFNGMQSGNNQFSMDGIDATRVDQAYMSNGSERGARLLTGSLDTINEFKVQSGDYSAEYGRASGAYVNIVTKSGTNNFHGTLFEFLRNDALDAKNFFQPPSTPAPIRFNNFGGNVGGPILHNRMFFFANYEGSRQSVGIVGSGTELSSLGMSQAVAKSPAVAPIVALMPTATSTLQYISNIVITPTANPLVSAVSFLGVNHVKESTGSMRIDNTWSNKDTSFGRININDSAILGPLIGVFATAFGAQDHQMVDTRTTNAAFSETHTFTPSLLNVFLMGAQRYATTFDQSEPFPVVNISGLNFAPGNRGLYGREPTDIQTGDSLTYVKGRHTVKGGVTVWHITEPYHGYLGGSSVTFASVQNFIDNVVTSASVSAPVPENTTVMNQVGAYVTDTWQVRPRLTVELGLRWDWNQVPHDSNHATQVWTNSTNSLTAKGDPYFKSYNKNYAPRIGLAWSPSSKIVLRAGYGFFVQALPIGSFANQVTNTLAGNATLSIVNIPSLSYPVTPFVSSGIPPPPSLSGYDYLTRNPKTEQWTASMGIQVSANTGLLLSYVGNHGFNLDVGEGVNFINPVTGVRPYPQYSNITVTTWNGQSKYEALQVSLRRRLSAGLSFSAEYAYSHTSSDSPDDGLFSTLPQQPFNLKNDWGNSTNDIRHNLSFNALYALPFGEGKQFLTNTSGVVKKAVSGWNLAVLGIARSGVAGTVFLGTNTYGDGNTTNQRPNIAPGANVYVASNSPSPANTVPYLNFSAFSLPATAIKPANGNPGIPGSFGSSPRGIFFGPHFTQVDLSIIKDTAILERLKLQFRAEIFNVFNHPNLDMPSTTWTPTGAASFGLIQNTVGRTIGFGTARQIQLGLKLTF